MSLGPRKQIVEGVIRPLAEAVSPRHRRWKRLLAGLSLDPDSLPRPIEPPGDRDFIICGVPRSGTSLLCGVLHQPPGVITVMEPWDGMRMAPAELFRSLRRELDETGVLKRGKLDLRSLSAQRDVRWQRDGAVASRVGTTDGYLLGVKWPAFWRYVAALPNTKFVITLRHPVEVISSFARVGGRLAQGLEYDIRFNRKMNNHLFAATPDRRMRRILLYDYINGTLLPHLEKPNVFVVRYERWFTDPDQVITELGEFLGMEVRGGRISITRPEPPRLSSEEIQLIGRHCRTARSLGYSLSSNRDAPDI